MFEVKAGSNAITTLASFNGTNGNIPLNNLLEDGSGNLFGTTDFGGVANDGVVFEVKANSNAITPLASFSGANGSLPHSALVEDASGNLFGTAESGAGGGTVFEVKANSNAITLLAAFNGANGQFPFAGMVGDGSGNLFGTTYGGGANGVGVVFEVQANSNTITTLASFNGTNGQRPYAGLVADGSGNLFGTTEQGGASGVGTVFEITLPPVIYTVSPQSALINGGSFTLTVHGISFQADSSVNWNGVPLATTYVSETQLTAVVPAGDLAQPYGSANVTVVNPTLDAGTTGPAIISLDSPTATVPTLTAPTSAAITLTTATLGGTAADNGSIIHKRGILYAPTATNPNPTLGGVGVIEVDDSANTTGAFSDSVTGLTANTSYSFVAFATNDIGTGYTSPVSNFLSVPLAVSSLSPPAAVINGPSFTLTVNGTNFQSNSTVNWNGAPLATTFVSAAQLTAVVPTGDLAVPSGSATITVFSPTGGTTSPVGFFLSATPLAPATIYVTTTADVLDNPTTVTVATLGPSVSLRDAINAANNSGGTNVIAPTDTAYSFTVADNTLGGANALPAINSNITIQGNGATLNGTGTTNLRFFFVSATGRLTLQNLTLSNALALGANGSGGGGGGGGLGGAVFNDGGTVVAQGCTFTGDKAQLAAAAAEPAAPWAKLEQTEQPEHTV